jgi:hypothetical protein
MMLRRKAEVPEGKTCTIATYSTKIPTWICLRSKLWLCLDKLRLSHGTAANSYSVSSCSDLFS